MEEKEKNLLKKIRQELADVLLVKDSLTRQELVKILNKIEEEN